MKAHPDILTTLWEDLSSPTSTVAVHPDKSRRALGRIVCSQDTFTDPQGHLRLSGCMKALRGLESEDIFCSEAQCDSPVRGLRLLDLPVPHAVEVPWDIRDIRIWTHLHNLNWLSRSRGALLLIFFGSRIASI